MTNRYKYFNEKGERGRDGRFAKGFRHTPESRAKISKSLKDQYANGSRSVIRLVGCNSPTWKGDDIGYTMIHRWLKQMFGQSNECESCHKISAPDKIHWANKSGKYLRDRSDWMRLCMSCHMKYDFANGFRKDKRNATTI